MKKKITVVAIFCLFVCILCGLTACGKDVDFIINFIVDEEIYATISTAGNETIEIPENPTKDGYVFEGWYWDENVWQQPFTANSLLDAPISSDMNVYAKFEDESGIKGSEIVISGFSRSEASGQSIFSLQVPNAYATLNFNTVVTVNSKATWTLSTDTTGNNTVAGRSVALNEGNNTYYATVRGNDGSITTYKIEVYRNHLYTVTIDPIFFDVYTLSVEEGKICTSPDELSKEGYIFNGWDYDFTQKISKSITVKAQWVPIQYVVSYELNGGTNSDKNPDGYTTADDVLLSDPTREGYIFKGWSENGEIPLGSIGDKTFVACWEADLSDIRFDNVSYVYDGEEKSIEIDGILPDGVTVRYENNTRTSAGNVDATAFFTIDDRGALPFDSLTATLTINESAVAGISLIDDTVVYDGNDHYLVVSGNIPEGVNVYYDDNGQSQAGSYLIRAYFEDTTGNYAVPDDLYGILTIEKATYEMSGVIFENATYTYDKTEKTVVIGGTLPTGVTVQYENNTRMNAGTQTATAIFTGDYNNYNQIDDMTATLTINKAAAIINTDNVGTVFTYTGREQSISGATGTGVITYENNSFTNAGNYIVTVKSAESANYLAGQTTVNVVVNKATVSGITFDNGTFTYDGTAKSIYIGGTLPNEVSVAYTNNGQTEAGEYTVTAKFTVSNNYNAIADKAATLTIVNAEIEGLSFTNKTVTYDGNAHMIEVVGAGDAIVTYNVANAYTNAGTYEVTATIRKANYNDVELTATLTINKAAAIINTDNVGTVFTYTGREQSISGATGTGVITYENNSFTNAGNYIVTVKSAESANYLAGQTTVNVVVNKATVVVLFGNASVEYDENEHSLFISGELPDGVTVSYDGNGQSAIGDYTITAHFVDTTGNYAVPESLTAVLTIAPSDNYCTIVFVDTTEGDVSYYLRKGTPITEIPTPVEEPGFTASYVYDFSSVTEDVVLEPTYEIINYSIEYVLTEGENDPRNVTSYTIVSSVTFYSPVYTFEGLLFDGWYTTESYTQGTKIDHVLVGTTGNLVLYAKWIAYRIESAEGFDFNYQDYELPAITMVAPNSKTLLTLSRAIVVSEGCTWTLSRDIEGENEIKTKNISLALGHNIAYITVWFSEDYNLVYIVDIYRLSRRMYSFYSEGEIYGDVLEAEEGSFIDAPAVSPTKTGYTFAYWHDGTEQADFPYFLTEDTTFTAVFTPNDYVITYDPNTGAIEKNKQAVTYDAAYELRTPTKKGYSFVEWQYNGVSFDDGVWSLTTDITLVAQWNANTYVVTYDPMGGTVAQATQEVVFDSPYELLLPVKEGYTFYGWYTEEDIEESDVWNVDHDITIYAEWRYYTVTTTTNMENAGTYTEKAEEKVTVGNEVTLTATTNNGYTWVGWYDGETKVSEGTSLTYTFTMTEEDKTYQARWTYYTVTTTTNMAEAGTYTEKAEEKVTVGNEITLTAATNNGYTWLGWYDGDNKVSEGISLTYTFTMSAENKTYTAKWMACPITLSKNIPEAGTVSGVEGATTVGGDTTITATTNSGYTWLGWYEGDIKVSEGTSLTYTFTMQAEDKTYQARWTYYSVTTTTNMAEAGTYTEKAEEKVTVGNEVTLTATTNDGYTWVGWYEGDIKVSEGNSLMYTFTMPAEDKIYTAKWSKVTLTSNDSSAGTITNLNDKYVFGQEVTISATMNDGYTWVGWYDGETKVSEGTSFTYIFTMSAENKTYTAKWIDCPVTLTKSIDEAGTVAGVEGATAVGDEVTIIATTNYGYTWVGWYNGEDLITMSQTFTFTMTEETRTYTATWELGYQNLTYDGNRVTGVVDKTVRAIAVPDTVTAIDEGAFAGCTNLVSITIPFVGAQAGKTSSDRYQYPFGYIFGTSSYDGGTATTQEYYGSYSVPTGEYYYIPSTLRSVTVTGGNILYGAFFNCSMLTSITIPDSVTSIGNYAFSGCTGLTSVTIGNSVTSIGRSAFSGCTGLTSVTIGNSVTSIGNYAFSGCTGLTSVTIGNSVTSIGNYAFSGCTGLTSVTIGNSVTSIGSSAFSGCTGLTSVTIGNSVTSIGRSAFSGCTGLTSVTIGDSVTSIGEEAFYNCTGLTSVTIGNSVTSIGSLAFTGCYKLVEVYNKSSLNITKGSSNNGHVGYYAKDIYTEPFESKLSTDENGFIIYTDNDVVSLIGYTGNETDLVLPNSITEIYKYAFYNCTRLTSVTIGNGVTSIGSSAFSGCYKLVEVYNKSSLNITKGSEDNGCVGYYAKDIYTDPFESKLSTDENGFIIYTVEDIVSLIGYKGAETNLVLPNSITEINQGAFIGCSGLTSVTIPDSVTSIGDGAFSGCIGLTSVIIPDSVTSIGRSAFSGCSKLQYNNYDNALYLGNNEHPYVVLIRAKNTDITTCNIEQTTKAISGNAFDGCTGLTSVTIPDSVTSIGSSAFQYCRGLTSVTIPDSVTSIGGGAFSGCIGLTSVTIPDSVTSIGGGAFQHCSGLTSVTIPDSVTSIGEGAFLFCTGLTSITIPDSVTSIGGGAFRYCSGLTSVTIPDSVTSIGSSAFSGCPIETATIPAMACSYIKNNNLKIVVITSGTSIGDDVFRGCTGLTSVTIPDSVTSIGNYAFSGCTGLTSITIPDSVMSIGNSAFYDCNNLTAVYYGGTVDDWNAISIGGWNDSLVNARRYYYTEEHPTEAGYYWHYENGEVVIGALGEHTYDTDATCITRVCVCGYVCAPTTEHDLDADCVCTICGKAVHSYDENGICTACGGLRGYSLGLAYEYNSSADSYTVTGIGTCTDTEIWIPLTYNGKEVTAIKNNAFSGNTDITKVVIADNIITVGRYAFQNCTGLTSVTIGSKVKEIGYYAFYGCTGLTSLYYTGDIASWCCIKHDSYTNPLESAHNLYINNELVTAITIPDTVTKIVGTATFVGWNGTSIVLPNTLTSIDGWTFYKCSNLTSITYNGTISQWNAISKGSNWNRDTGSYKIYCTDGTINK